MKTRHYLYINLEDNTMSKKIIRLTESDLHNIVRTAVRNILRESHGWQYPNYGLSDDEMQSCKKNAYNYAREQFPNVMPCDALEELYKATYKDYLKQATRMSDEQIEEEYQHAIKILKKYSWAHLEATALEQGWWHYIDYISKQ